MLLELVGFFINDIFLKINLIKLPGTNIGMVTFIVGLFIILVSISIIKVVLGLSFGNMSSLIGRIGKHENKKE